VVDPVYIGTTGIQSVGMLRRVAEESGTLSGRGENGQGPVLRVQEDPILHHPRVRKDAVMGGEGGGVVKSCMEGEYTGGGGEK
jgi:hypothetical protein